MVLSVCTSRERIITGEEVVEVMSSEEERSDQQNQSGSQLEAGEEKEESVEHSI